MLRLIKEKFLILLESKNIFPSIPVKQNIYFLPIIFDQDKNEISTIFRKLFILIIGI